MNSERRTAKECGKPVAYGHYGGNRGNLVGERLLRRIPEPIYRRLGSALVLALGVLILMRTAI